MDIGETYCKGAELIQISQDKLMASFGGTFQLHTNRTFLGHLSSYNLFMGDPAHLGY
jgi:hypothetical protein